MPRSSGTPRRRDDPLPRPRLLDRLQRAHEQRCIVVRGPAGSGKSTLIDAWERMARAQQAQIVRVSGGEPDFLRLLAGRAGDVDALDRAGLAEASEISLRHIAIALVRSAPALTRPVVLVLDELHALPDPAILQGLQPLLDYGPPRLQCLFATRRPLPLSLGRLRAHGQLLELGPDDLRWTMDETAALLRQRLGAEAAARAGEWLAATDGWSLGLASMCRAERSGLGASAASSEVATFLDAEVLAGLPRDVQQLLIRISAFEPFDASLAAQVSGLEVDACRGHIEALSESLGMIEAVPGALPRWRLQACLGRRLGARFATEPVAARRRLHRIASLHFAEHGLQQQAVAHALAAGLRGRAADLMERWAPSLFREGRHERLAGLLRLLHHAAPDPRGTGERRAGPLRGRPRLRLWMALLALLEQRFDDCRSMLDDLDRDVAAADAATRSRLHVLRGWLAVSLDDMPAAIAVYPRRRMPRRGLGVDEITLAGERNVLSWIHLYRNDYALVRRLQEPGPATAQAPGGTMFGSLTGRCLAGLSLALEGRMNAAERVYRDVLDRSALDPEACVDPALLATGLLAETLYELHDLSGVMALEPRLPELQRRLLPDPLLRAMLCIARAHAVRGAVEDAMRVLDSLHAHAAARGLDRLRAYALLEQLRLRLLRHDTDRARSDWEELGILRAAHERDASTVLAEVSLVVDRAEILVHGYAGRHERAGACIDRLLVECTRRGRRRRVAALWFQRAAVDRELGDEAGARRHALQGLQLGHQLELIRSLLDAHPAVPDLLEGAIALQGRDALLTFHADRLRAAAGFGSLAASALGAVASDAASRRAPLEPLSDREAQIAGLLARALPNKEIARALGLSPETVKWHLHNVYAKLGVGTRYEAVSLLRAAGGTVVPGFMEVRR